MKTPILLSRIFGFLIVAFLFDFTSCGKSIPETNPDLVGYWVNTTYCQDQLTIRSNGTGKYKVRGVSVECKSGNRREGETELIRGKIIKIDNMRFEIISGPERIDTMEVNVDSVHPYTGKSVMSMELQKTIFNHRQKTTYYKIIGR